MAQPVGAGRHQALGVGPVHGGRCALHHPLHRLVEPGRGPAWRGLGLVFVVQVGQDRQVLVGLIGDGGSVVLGQVLLELVDQGRGHYDAAVLRALADHVQDPADALGAGGVDVVDGLQVATLGRAQLRGAKSGRVEPVQRARAPAAQQTHILGRHGFKCGPLIAREGPAGAQRPHRDLGRCHPREGVADHVALLHEEVEQATQDPLCLLPRRGLQRAFERPPQRRPALQVARRAPASRRLLQERHEGHGVFGRERGHGLAALQHGPQQQALGFAPVGALRVRLFLLRGQPGRDRLIVVAGRQQAALRPECALTAVQLGWDLELFQGDQVGGGSDHQSQLPRIGLRSANQRVLADGQVRGICVQLHPLGDARSLELADTWRDRPPSPAHAVDAFGQQEEGVQAGLLEVAGQGGCKPGLHAVAAGRQLTDRLLQPVQGKQLPLDQPGTSLQPGALFGVLLRGLAVFLDVALNLLGLAEILHANGLDELLQCGRRLGSRL